MSLTKLKEAALAIQSLTRQLEIHSDVRLAGLIKELNKFATIYNKLPPAQKQQVSPTMHLIYASGHKLYGYLSKDTAWQKFQGGQLAYGKSDAQADLGWIQRYKTLSAQNPILAAKLPVRPTGNIQGLQFPGLAASKQSLSSYYGDVFSGLYIEQREDIMIAYSLFKIVDIFKGSTHGIDLWNEVSTHLRKSTVPVLITEVKHKLASEEKFEWQGAAHSFQAGVSVVWIKDFVLTGGDSQMPALCATLQNELFELAWRKIYGDEYVENRAVQALSALVSGRVLLLASKTDLDEAKCLSEFKRLYNSDEYKRYKPDPKTENSKKYLGLTGKLAAFASKGKYSTLADLKNAAGVK